MPNLFPENYENEIVEPADIESNNAIGYRSGVLFDYRTGDFARDGMHKGIDCTGIESWKAWCINCVQTERYAHLGYNSDFGIETTKVFQAESHEEAESILIRQITEALLADPYGRTEYIEDISVDWTAPDTVFVSMTVHGIDDVTIDIEANITKGEV